jgi:hypothetical protein
MQKKIPDFAKNNSSEYWLTYHELNPSKRRQSASADQVPTCAEVWPQHRHATVSMTGYIGMDSVPAAATQAIALAREHPWGYSCLGRDVLQTLDRSDQNVALVSQPI